MKALNEDLQMRSDWLLPLCTGSERLKDPDGRKGAPTQKPEALLLPSVMLAATRPGEPRARPLLRQRHHRGGRQAAAAGDWIGIEREARLRRNRRNAAASPSVAGRSTTSELVDAVQARAAKRVPFGWLIERGLLEPGSEVLFDASGAAGVSARVRADGTLIAADFRRGSIHKVGAHVQGAPACNGWTFWYMRHQGKDVPIDLFRQKLRAELN